MLNSESFFAAFFQLSDVCQIHAQAKTYTAGLFIPGARKLFLAQIRHILRQIDPTLAKQLIETATSWRDKAILTLLYRTGQRIGDWSSFAGRHGILGMILLFLDRMAAQFIERFRGSSFSIERHHFGRDLLKRAAGRANCKRTRNLSISCSTLSKPTAPGLVFKSYQVMGVRRASSGVSGGSSSWICSSCSATATLHQQIIEQGVG